MGISFRGVRDRLKRVGYTPAIFFGLPLAASAIGLATYSILHDPNAHISFVTGYYDHLTTHSGAMDVNLFNHGQPGTDTCTTIHPKDTGVYNRFIDFFRGLYFGDGVTLKANEDFYMTPCK